MSTGNEKDGPSNTQLIVVRWKELIKSKILEWAGSNGSEVNKEQLQQLLRTARNEYNVAETEAEPYARKLLKEHNILLTSGALFDVFPPAQVEVEAVAGKTTEELAAPPAPWCPVCRQQVAGQQDKYCGKCGVSLQCPRCQHPFQDGNSFCSRCGFDTVLVPLIHEQMRLGRQFFQIARTIPADQGLEQADKARAAFSKALGYSPDNPEAKSALKQAQDRFKDLLHLISDEARRSGRLAQAIGWYERIGRESGLQQFAAEKIQEIRQVREGKLKEAREDARNRRWPEAIQTLSTLAQQFPEDVEISGLLREFQQQMAEFRKKEARAREVLTKLIPKLGEEKRIVAILELLKELEQNQVNFKNQLAALATFRQTLDQADALADRAERHWAACRFRDAMDDVANALEIVADHARALTIKERLDERQRLRLQLDREIKGKRWYLARRTLSRLDGSEPYAAQKQEIESALFRAREFCRFVLWSTVAGCLLLLATRMTQLLQKDLSSEQSFGMGPFSQQVLNPAITLTSLVICAYCLAAFVTCFFRPLNWKTALGWLGVVVAAAACGSLAWSAVANYWLGDSESFGGKLVAFASTIAVTALLGAMLGYVAVVLADNGLTDMNRLFSRIHRHALVTGAASVVICMAAATSRWNLLQYLPLTFLFFGLLMLAGLIHNYMHFHVLVLAAVIASGVSQVIGMEQHHWPSLTMTGVILVTAGFFILPTRHMPNKLFPLGILASIALCADQLIVGDAWAPVLVPAWFFVCGGMACDRFSMPDRRFHLLDRSNALFSWIPTEQ